MSVETRLKVAFERKLYLPDEDGERTQDVDIPGDGLTLDEVTDHRWVEDASVNDDGTVRVSVLIGSEPREDISPAELDIDPPGIE